MNQAIGQSFVNHAPIMANSVHNTVLKTLQDRGMFGFVGPAYQQASQMVFAPTGSATETSPIDPQSQADVDVGNTQPISTTTSSVFSCVYQFHTNGYTCTGKLHDRVPSWLESCYWIWNAPKVHGVIFSRATKLIGLAADEPAS